MSRDAPVAWDVELVAELRAAEIAYRQDPGADDDISMLRSAIAEIERLGRAISDGANLEETLKRIAVRAEAECDSLRAERDEYRAALGRIVMARSLVGLSGDEVASAVIEDVPYAVDILALLKAAKCPNAGCWDGAIPSGDREDPDWSQCQWCYERDAALAKSPNPSGQLTVEASAAQAGRAAAPGLDTEASGPVGLGPQSPCPCCGMCHGPGLSANAIITAPVEPLTGRCRHEDSHDGLPCMECGRTATPSSGTSTEQEKP